MGEDILVVEDSPTQAVRLQHIFERAGYRVTVRPNGALALLHLRMRPATVVITDIDMPEMDGYSLCRRIKADVDLRATPVILLTALTDPSAIVRALECAADSFISKPFTDAQVLRQVQTLLAPRPRPTGGDDATLVYEGQRYQITLSRQQMLDLLLAVYATAVQKNQELQQAQQTLAILNAQLMQQAATRNHGADDGAASGHR
jgi:DNA-binding response OmpR family regulator